MLALFKVGAASWSLNVGAECRRCVVFLLCGAVNIGAAWWLLLVGVTCWLLPYGAACWLVVVGVVCSLALRIGYNVVCGRSVLVVKLKRCVLVVW